MTCLSAYRDRLPHGRFRNVVPVPTGRGIGQIRQGIGNSKPVFDLAKALKALNRKCLSFLPLCLAQRKIALITEPCRHSLLIRLSLVQRLRLSEQGLRLTVPTEPAI